MVGFGEVTTKGKLVLTSVLGNPNLISSLEGAIDQTERQLNILDARMKARVLPLLFHDRSNENIPRYIGYFVLR